jgi:hypothetical protein
MGNNPRTANGPDRRMTGEISDTVERDLRDLIAEERPKRLAVVAGILTKPEHGTRGLCS